MVKRSFLFLSLSLLQQLSINEAFCSRSTFMKPEPSRCLSVRNTSIKCLRRGRPNNQDLNYDNCRYVPPLSSSPWRSRRCQFSMKHVHNSISGDDENGGNSRSSSNGRHICTSADRVRPFPNMPSQNFLTLAQSQLDLLASTLLQFSGPASSGDTRSTTTKVQSMALYLPRENVSTGQLEFVPVVTWPSVDSQRVWIASDALSKQPPSIPKTLSRIPGFTHAKSLLPRYPFAAHPEFSSLDNGGGATSSPAGSSSTSMSCGVGPVEAIPCPSSVARGSTSSSSGSDYDHGQGDILSVALYRGSLTVGVLLVWPTTTYPSASRDDPPLSFWTQLNYKQVSNAAYGLSIALSMDIEGSHQEERISTTSIRPTTPRNGSVIGTSTVATQPTQPPSTMIINRGRRTTKTNNNENGSVFVQPFYARLHPKESNSVHADLYAYASAQAYRDLVEAQLTQTEHLRRALSDNLHQVKNPLQALRAFGKLLQRKLAIDEPSTMISSSTSTSSIEGSPTMPLRELADRMMIQTDRVIELLKPMENIIDQLEVTSTNTPQQYLYLPAGSSSNSSLSIQYYLKPAPVDVIRSTDQDGESLRYFYLPGSNGNSSPTIHYLTPAKYTSNSPRPQFTSHAARENSKSSDLILEVEKQKPPPLVSSNFQTKKLFPELPISSKEVWGSSRRQYDGTDNEVVPKYNNNIEMVFISDVIEPILSNAAVVAADRHVKFEVIPYDEDELPGLMICPKSLQEALANVIENAIKYVVLPSCGSSSSSRTTGLPSDSSTDRDIASNPDPLVRVSVIPNPHPEYPKGVSIIVEDNGPGIPRQEREAIFQRGFRGIHTKDILSGNGLGLDISRSMLSQFGGTVQVLENEAQHLSGTVMRIMVFR